MESETAHTDTDDPLRGLTATQRDLLRVVTEHDGGAGTDIIQPAKTAIHAAKVPDAVVYQNLADLVDSGHLDTAPDAENGRRKRYHVTDHGHAALDQLRTEINQTQTQQ